MKKVTLFFLAAFAAFASCLAASFSFKMNDDPEEEPIPLQYNESGEGDANLRGNTYATISATYNPSLCRISVVFSSINGNIDIRLTNLTSGGSSTVQTDALLGNVYVPVLYGSGYYYVEFFCNGTMACSGYFNVQ